MRGSTLAWRCQPAPVLSQSTNWHCDCVFTATLLKLFIFSSRACFPHFLRSRVKTLE